MSAPINFDTHGCVKQLMGAGFAESQAESVVTVVAMAINENVATKQDLAELETRMTVRMVLINLAVAGLILALG